MKDWVCRAGTESVRIGLELSQFEWAGQRPPEDRVTSLVFSDSSWCVNTMAKIVNKEAHCGSQVPVNRSVDLWIQVVYFTVTFFFFGPKCETVHVVDLLSRSNLTGSCLLYVQCVGFICLC